MLAGLRGNSVGVRGGRWVLCFGGCGGCGCWGELLAGRPCEVSSGENVDV